MGSRKDLNITNLSKWRYRELKYFCLQYPEWKEKLNSIVTVKAMNITDMPKGNSTGNTTENEALAKIELKEKCRAVEQSAVEADTGIYQELLKNVTQGISYFYLNVPCSKEYFYKKRRDFFNILSKKI